MVRKERLELSRREALEPKSSVSTNSTTPASGVGDGARTRDNRNHNPGLYQLSYAHHNNCSNYLNLELSLNLSLA
jgi:hypothetical protein